MSPSRYQQTLLEQIRQELALPLNLSPSLNHWSQWVSSHEPGFEPEASEREVVPGVLRGYRSWGLTPDGVLTALNSPGLKWGHGKNTAMCANGHFVVPPTGYQNRLLHAGEAPVDECTCGIYAMHSPELINTACHYACGSIKAYGKVILHEDGFRTQYAEIESLVLHPLITNVSVISGIEERYRVPIYISAAELLYHHPPISVEHLLPQWTPTGYWCLPDPLLAEEPSDG